MGQKDCPSSGHPGIGTGPYANLDKSCIHMSVLPRYCRKHTRMGSYAKAMSIAYDGVGYQWLSTEILASDSLRFAIREE